MRDFIACIQMESYKYTCFRVQLSVGFKYLHAIACLLIIVQDRVVRKVVYANAGFKVNWNIDFSFLKMFFTPYVLCSLHEIIQAQHKLNDNLSQKTHRKVLGWTTQPRSLSFAFNWEQDQHGGEFNCRAKYFELCRKMQHYADIFSMYAKIC